MNARTGMQGFSLVEMIAVIVLLAVGLVSLLQVFGTATRTIGHNVDGLLGAQLAQEGAERVLTDRRVRGYGYATTPGIYPPEPTIAGFPNYSRTTVFTAGAAPCAPGETCQQVTVTVTRGGQRVGLTTLMIGAY